MLNLFPPCLIILLKGISTTVHIISNDENKAVVFVLIMVMRTILGR